MLLCAVAGFYGFAADSVELDTSLLDKAYAETYIDNKSAVSWKDYDSGKQIRDMGRRLGSEIKYQEQVNKAVSPYASGFPALKYKVVRIYPGEKAGADVLYIAKNAEVNTIKNLRRIVSGYIEKAYDIPMDKADTIAIKVCYWNTNHYNDLAFFRSTFQGRVLDVFANRTKIMGLARSYKNWPGKTRLVIPFVLIKEVVPQAVEPTPVAPAVSEEKPAVQEVIPQPAESSPAPEQPAKNSHVSPVSVILIILFFIAILILAVIVIKHFMAKKDEDSDFSQE
jgi:hypothetical protein